VGSLKVHIEERLQKARERNDGDLDPVQTARLRGEISCLKRLLALGKDESPPIRRPIGAADCKARRKESTDGRSS